MLDVNTNMMNDDPAVTFEALAVNEELETVRELVKSADFVPGTGTTTVLTFARAQADSDSQTDGAQAVVAFETEGTYNGAMGTYKCNAEDGGSDCSVTLDAKGAITAMSDGWIFTPATGAKSYVADAEYLHYGFWLMRTTKDGATTYNEVETFADSSLVASTVAELDDVVGAASYEGGSVGVYVKNVLDDQANIVSATSGHFSADVELTANFGGGNVPDNNQYTVEGTVTDFALQYGEENDWAVKLGLVDFSGRAADAKPGESDPGTSHTNDFSGVATGDSTALAGSWSGTFHGPTPPTEATDDDADDRVAPAQVVGEFNANFTDGTAAGGFGANKQ